MHLNPYYSQAFDRLFLLRFFFNQFRIPDKQLFLKCFPPTLHSSMLYISPFCQCALQRDPPCARKSDPPLGVMCKDTKWGFNEGGKRGSATLRLSSPPRASTIRARPFVKDGCVSGGFRFLFQ